MWYVFLIASLFSAPLWASVLDNAVVISLARHMHRFETTKELMEAAGFTNVQRFEAIDGRNTHLCFFEALNIYKGKPGEKGCAASHLLVWEEFLNDSGKEALFVAEDDMLPHSQFAELFPLYWKQTPKDFDIILVGNQMDVSKRAPLVISQPAFCLHAYIISKKGARKLLDAYQLISPDDDKNMHVIDVFLREMMKRSTLIYYCYNGSKYRDEVNIKNGNIWPNRDSGICFQNHQLESSIR